MWLVGVRAAEDMRLRRVCDRVSWGAGEAEKLHVSSKGRMGQGGD